MKLVQSNLFIFLTSSIFVTQVFSNTSHQMERIVGGTVAATPLPYLVSIYSTTSGHFCGGALISRQTVLTAASCFTSNQITLPEQFGVLADSITANNGTGVTRSVYSISTHPSYIESIRSSDLALVTLKTPFENVTNITPIDLANSDVAVGTACTISGWGGRYFYEHFSGELRTLAVSIVDPESTCVPQYNPSPLSFDVLVDSQICASAVNPTHTVCTSDVGGPLVCNNALFGVLTWGNGCGIPAPGVYTNVVIFNSWITATMQAKELKAASSDKHIDASALFIIALYSLSRYFS